MRMRMRMIDIIVHAVLCVEPLVCTRVCTHLCDIVYARILKYINLCKIVCVRACGVHAPMCK